MQPSKVVTYFEFRDMMSNLSSLAILPKLINFQLILTNESSTLGFLEIAMKIASKQN